MPNNLPNTGIQVWNDTTDAQGSFKDYYNMLSGITNSNMVKIDQSIGSIFGRGYLTSEKLQNTDLNTIVSNGLYSFNSHTSAGITNAPMEGQDITFGMIVICEVPTVCVQWCMQAYPSVGNNVWYRRQAVGVWSNWVQIATTEKTDVLLTPKTGVKINSNRSYILNNELIFNIQVAKSDDGVFPTGRNIICDIPVNFSDGGIALTCSCMSSGGQIVQGGNAIAENWNKQVQVYLSSSDVSYINISGIVRR